MIIININLQNDKSQNEGTRTPKVSKLKSLNPHEFLYTQSITSKRSLK